MRQTLDERIQKTCCDPLRILESVPLKVFPLSDFSENKAPKEISNKAYLYDFVLGEKHIKLIDLFHFAAQGKKNDDDFYTPVMELLRPISS